MKSILVYTYGDPSWDFFIAGVLLRSV